MYFIKNLSKIARSLTLILKITFLVSFNNLVTIKFTGNKVSGIGTIDIKGKILSKVKNSKNLTKFKKLAKVKKPNLTKSNITEAEFLKQIFYI